MSRGASSTLVGFRHAHLLCVAWRRPATLLTVHHSPLGGFLLSLDHLPSVLKWIRWLCPLKYAPEAVGSNELVGLELVDNLAGVPIRTPVSLFAGGLFGFQDGSYYRDPLVLALPFLVVSTKAGRACRIERRADARCSPRASLCSLLSPRRR